MANTENDETGFLSVFWAGTDMSAGKGARQGQAFTLTLKGGIL